MLIVPFESQISSAIHSSPAKSLPCHSFFGVRNSLVAALASDFSDLHRFSVLYGQRFRLVRRLLPFPSAVAHLLLFPYRRSICCESKRNSIVNAKFGFTSYVPATSVDSSMPSCPEPSHGRQCAGACDRIHATIRLHKDEDRDFASVQMGSVQDGRLRDNIHFQQSNHHCIQFVWADSVFGRSNYDHVSGRSLLRPMQRRPESVCRTAC